jgi:hypothetical protein
MLWVRESEEMCQGYAKPSCKLALGPFVDVIAVDEHRGLGGRVTKDTLWIRGPHPIPPEFDFERQKWIFADNHTPGPRKVHLPSLQTMRKGCKNTPIASSITEQTNSATQPCSSQIQQNQASCVGALRKSKEYITASFLNSYLGLLNRETPQLSGQ